MFAWRNTVDDADVTQARLEKEQEAVRPLLRYEIPAGEPGECGYCGEEAPRLIEGLCPRCRDLLGRG